MSLDVTTLDPANPADLVEWSRVINRTFLSTRSPEQAAELRRQFYDFDRTLAARDGDAIVGTYRTYPTELTVPGGGQVTADAVTGVTVSATHRRRGLLTRMMRLDLDGARERGEPVAILIAAEWRIYGRFGFGPASEHVALTVDTRSAQFAVPGSGRVEFVDAATMRKHAPAIYDRHRSQWPSEIGRMSFQWDMDFGVIETPWAELDKQVFAMCFDEAGEPVGYVVYTAKDDWEARVPRCAVTVSQLLAATPEAYARLWRFLCEIDWIMTIKAEDRSVDERLPWLLSDARAVRQSDRSDFQWVRIIDTEAALSRRRYLYDGSLVLEVVDRDGYAGGRFELVGGPDGAQCARTTREPDLTLDVRLLGSIYLGGFSLATMAHGGGVEEHRPGALARADAMFRSTVTPWSATWF